MPRLVNLEIRGKGRNSISSVYLSCMHSRGPLSVRPRRIPTGLNARGAVYVSL